MCEAGIRSMSWSANFVSLFCGRGALSTVEESPLLRRVVRRLLMMQKALARKKRLSYRIVTQLDDGRVALLA